MAAIVKIPYFINKYLHHFYKPQLYFLHIPKTAGTTLTKYLRAQFPKRFIYSSTHWSAGQKSPDQRHIALIYGHFGYSLVKHLRPNHQVITLLRDPIEQTISSFHHMKFDPKGNAWVEPGFLAESDSLENIFSSKKAANFSNLQSRYLALDLDVNKSLGSEDFYLDSWSDFTQPTLGDEDLLDLAKKHLEAMPFFGITEYFQESLIMLADTFPWPLKIDNEKLQSVGDRPSTNDLAPATLSAIKENNQIDIELYDFAKSQFLKSYVTLINRRLDLKVSQQQFLENRGKYNRQLIDHLVEHGYEE